MAGVQSGAAGHGVGHPGPRGRGPGSALDLSGHCARAGRLPLGPNPAAFVAANAGEIETQVLPWLLTSLSAVHDDVVIVLDDFHFVREQACHDQMAFLVEHLPPHCHFVIATRSDPGLRLGRLRASGQLGEVRAADLAFSVDEATTLLTRQEVRLSSPQLTELVDRTEGWPAGLYLASLSLSGRSDPDGFVRQFSGNDRFVGDYLTEEVLGRQTDEVREFITTVSILDRLSAPLCDFVAETTGSAVTLRQLERANMFLVPLDRHGHWYRFHHLFASAARSELAISRPDRVAALHDRAATWFRERGDIDEAIKHLLEAGNTDDAAQLVQANWMQYANAGRTATVVGWLRALGSPSHPRDPATAVTASWMAALSGDEAALTAHLGVLEEFRDDGPLPDGTRSVESAIALIQGLFGFGGPVEMSAAAQRAVELETDVGSPFHAIAHVSLGHAAYVAGDLERAGHFLGKATPNEAAQAIVRVLSASIHSLVEAESGHHDRAGSCRSGHGHGGHARPALTAAGVDRVHGSCDDASSVGRHDGSQGWRRPWPRRTPPQPHPLAMADDASSPGSGPGGLGRRADPEGTWAAPRERIVDGPLPGRDGQDARATRLDLRPHA